LSDSGLRAENPEVADESIHNAHYKKHTGEGKQPAREVADIILEPINVKGGYTFFTDTAIYWIDYENK